jgi:pimeloyl-ACP methyl ester carboxylesterase
MIFFKPRWLPVFLLILAAAGPSLAQVPKVGVVLMHGAAARSDSMAAFGGKLRDQGHLVANLDMPWSNEVAHRVPVEAAERQVLDAMQDLRRRGAHKVVLAGFSKGGMFAAYVATRMPVDGLVLIAPNGGADHKRLQEDVARARSLVAAGKGEEKTLLHDGDVTGDGRYPMPDAIPSAWLSWFDPQGSQNFERVFRSQRPGVPVLLVVPTRDLENLLKVKQRVWQGLPPHPGNRLFEPQTDHLGAVAHSEAETVRWIAQVVQQGR